MNTASILTHTYSHSVKVKYISSQLLSVEWIMWSEIKKLVMYVKNLECRYTYKLVCADTGWLPRRRRHVT